MEGGGEISSFYDKEEAILGIALILILVPSFIERFLIFFFFPSDFACKRSMMIYIRSIILFFYFLFFYFIFSVHNMKLSPNRGFMVVCGDNVPFVGSTEAT